MAKAVRWSTAVIFMSWRNWLGLRYVARDLTAMAKHQLGITNLLYQECTTSKQP